MATITVCDGGCGAQSPDFNARPGGPHVANNWLRVRAARNAHFDARGDHDDKLFCDNCAKPVLALLRKEGEPS